MLKLTRKHELEHIKTVGVFKFNADFIKAVLILRNDRRLVGLERIRGQLAREMALRMTGFPARPFDVPLKPREKPTQEMQNICDAHLRNCDEKGKRNA